MNKNTIFSIDIGLLAPALILVILGLTTLFSINIQFFKSQFLFLVLGIIAYLFFSQVSHKVMQLYAGPFYIVSLILLTITFFIGIESRGAVRWVDILGFRIQFSEVLKPILAVSLSSYLSKGIGGFRSFISVLCFFVPIAILIFMQPDLGNALLYTLTLLLSLFAFGFPMLWFGALFFTVLLSLPFGWNLLHNYQRERIVSFFHPLSDPLGKSYNAIQSIIAVGSGGVFGKGFNESTQSALRFLPERQTDFIFATLTEGLGFLGALVVLGAFLFLLQRIFVLYSLTDDPFCKLFSACVFFLIALQFFINIGMNIGILPVVGITLPFVSYGGSSLVSNFIILGIISSMSKTLKGERVLEIR